MLRRVPSALTLALTCTMAQAQPQVPAPAASASAARGRATSPAPRTGDYIVAIVNQELVTASEVQSRMARIREDAARNRGTLPPDDELRRQLIELMIDERAQLTYARESGQRVDDVELDRAVGNVALQNQVTMEQLRERLRREGIDYTRFRNNLRDQILTERVREREVQGRIRVTELEIDAFLDQRRAAGSSAAEYNIAQILVSVPDGASLTEAAQRRARIEAAAARVKGGESFEAVARELFRRPQSGRRRCIGHAQRAAPPRCVCGDGAQSQTR